VKRRAFAALLFSALAACADAVPPPEIEIAPALRQIEARVVEWRFDPGTLDSPALAAEWERVLRQALDKSKLFGGGGRRLVLNARLIRLERPGFGLDMTARAVAAYRLYEDGRLLREFQIEGFGLAGIREENDGPERARLALRRALRDNALRFATELAERGLP